MVLDLTRLNSNINQKKSRDGIVSLGETEVVTCTYHTICQKELGKKLDLVQDQTETKIVKPKDRVLQFDFVILSHVI